VSFALFTMATATEQVSEVLLGTTNEPGLSQQARAAFFKHAQKDEESGEYYLTESAFINLIAPASEDYVSLANRIDGDVLGPPLKPTYLRTRADGICLRIAQDQARAVQCPLPSRRSSE
jgi:hypothetical protein